MSLMYCTLLLLFFRNRKIPAAIFKVRPHLDYLFLPFQPLLILCIYICFIVSLWHDIQSRWKWQMTSGQIWGFLGGKQTLLFMSLTHSGWNIFIFLYETCDFPILIELIYPIKYKLLLVWIMAQHWTCDKPLSEPVFANSRVHIYIYQLASMSQMGCKERSWCFIVKWISPHVLSRNAEIMINIEI